MNLKRARPEIQKSRLENEVILAVIILYVLLSAVLLAIHQMQPDEAPTKTSSTSPAHDDFSAKTKRISAAITEPMTLPQARQALARGGFKEIRDVHAGGSGFQAIATRDGKPWQVEIDAATGQILRTPLAAR